MSNHSAQISWQRTTEDFSVENYNRKHTWQFAGGIKLDASSAPEYRGDPSLANPEEALVAALSSCHMLTFLALASKKGLTLDSYQDNAIGVLEKNSEGQMAITKVTLRPKIVWQPGTSLSSDEVMALHDKAHHACFIANSVKTEIVIVPA